MASVPRVLRTRNSLSFTYVTCPTVGSSVLGRMSAFAACSTKALAPAVEKTAVPLSKVAEGVPSRVASVAELAPESIKRAAPARTWMLPFFSVLRKSPPNTVEPTDADVAPTLALVADVTVPMTGAGEPYKGIRESAYDNTTARTACGRN